MTASLNEDWNATVTLMGNSTEVVSIERIITPGGSGVYRVSENATVLAVIPFPTDEPRFVCIDSLFSPNLTVE